ncbi:DUF1542 domain-containing protein [Staphylococcus saccharolyticus]|uniref:DUF1542 domain-containing protein n=1 Tax=Staphylococcus saccharolyticus TaxID=33028 RepID=UPI0013EE9B3F|nr:DUF1542 domain-containing protein [Staphylococcus saccharolyticus]MBL7573205.1 DUF1542 domain-containing protein [Staphylococcus saccharolyticus]MBL7583861.1 DUF1542 domain-containing protein [Staphylococcus saccharolyticus]MBL7638821.1 DUF1542 domain-containing protein [Staphylococcus saccharolyticus]QRJ67697.1 DUF1542 domain-containing protein [Staphylococcus saccharolyticus]
MKIISPSTTNKVAHNLTAKVEIILADDSKIIVNVPVNVVEKELQVAKEDAIKEINKVAHQKLEEIDNRKDLTSEQKAIAKAEVQHLQHQAIKKINSANTVSEVEKQQIKNNDEIHNFDYKQFILDKTKKDNKAEEAINS